MQVGRVGAVREVSGHGLLGLVAVDLLLVAVRKSEVNATLPRVPDRDVFLVLVEVRVPDHQTHWRWPAHL
jgi:hypothetical protein